MRSPLQTVGDQQLEFIAVELVRTVRANVSVYWTVKQTARAKIAYLSSAAD